MHLARVHIFIAIALASSSCAFTEKDMYGYSTAELMQRADRAEEAAPNDPQVQAIVRIRGEYRESVLAGDSRRMRETLNRLNKALDKWEGR